jgi:hypothetical protein
VKRGAGIVRPFKYRIAYSVPALTFGGIILVGLGLYFLFIRPPLPAEAPRYMGASLAYIQVAFPGFLSWLPRVFAVMGGFMLSTNILTRTVAQTSFRRRMRGSPPVAALSWLSSIGLMVVVNFIINSDFKWLLLAFSTPWLISLGLHYQEGKWKKNKTD